MFCSAIRWAVAFIGTMPLADSRLRKALRVWAKLADPARIAHGSRNRYAEIQRDPPPFPHTSSLAHDCIFIEVHRAEGLSHDLGWVDTAVALAGSL